MMHENDVHILQFNLRKFFLGYLCDLALLILGILIELQNVGVTDLPPLK